MDDIRVAAQALLEVLRERWSRLPNDDHGIGKSMCDLDEALLTQEKEELLAQEGVSMALANVTDEQLEALRHTASRELVSYRREQSRRHDLRFPHRHNVIIKTPYGETDRRCYCMATDGKEHHEREHPWIEKDGTEMKVR